MVSTVWPSPGPPHHADRYAGNHPRLSATTVLPVYELTPTHASLEEAFMEVTKDSIEYHAGATR
jgi:ABC-2 type transport system ATP-binding protein